MTSTTIQVQGAAAIDLDKLEALARAATPGPWTYSPMTETEDPEIGAANGSRVAALVAADMTKQNSRFIAEANPATVLDLITLARRATAPHAGAEPADWRRLTDDNAPDGERPIDVTLANGVTLERARYEQIDWTQVRDWRYSAAQPVEAAGIAVQAEAITADNPVVEMLDAIIFEITGDDGEDDPFTFLRRALRELMDYRAKEEAAAMEAATHPSEPVGGILTGEQIEAAAKAIYSQFGEGAIKHPWVELGNSDKQYMARKYARAALEAVCPEGGALVAKDVEYWRKLAAEASARVLVLKKQIESAAAPAELVYQVLLDESGRDFTTWLDIKESEVAAWRARGFKVRSLAQPTTQAEGK